MTFSGNCIKKNTNKIQAPYNSKHNPSKFALDFCDCTPKKKAKKAPAKKVKKVEPKEEVKPEPIKEEPQPEPAPVVEEIQPEPVIEKEEQPVKRSREKNAPEVIPGRFIVKTPEGYYINEKKISQSKGDAHIFLDFNKAVIIKKRYGGKVIKL